jgi:hypothetical protein
VGLVVGKVTTKQVAAVAAFRRGRQGLWKSRPNARGSSRSRIGGQRAIALALGFVLGAAVVALGGQRQVEVVQQGK